MADDRVRGLAPEPLLLVQELVNTLDLEAGEDAIGDPDTLSAWLSEQGFASDPAPTRSDLARVVAIREGLRAVLDAHNGGTASAAHIECMNDALAGAEVTLHIGADGSAALDGRKAVDQAVARIAQAVVAAEADGTWRRLKTCRDDGCRWAFYDASRNRSGVWCDMALCGSRTKVRAYRSRRADRLG